MFASTWLLINPYWTIYDLTKIVNQIYILGEIGIPYKGNHYTVSLGHDFVLDRLAPLQTVEFYVILLLSCTVTYSS